MTHRLRTLILLLLLLTDKTYSSERLSLAVSDWATAETLNMLEITPIAVAQLRGYQTWTGGEPTLDGAIDIGLRSMPNLELIADYKPNIIFGNNPILLRHTSEIAPTIDTSLYPFSDTPWESVIDFTFDIARHLGMLSEAQKATAHANQQIATLKSKIKDNETPVLVVQFRDDRHAWVYGNTSLLQGVIDQLGLTNAWDRPGSDIGISVVPIEVLAKTEGHLFIIESPAFQTAIRERLEGSGIWKAIVKQREGRISYLPANYWPIGALPSALRFAESLSSALESS